jgi:predicted HD phosphohydrolase
MIVDEIFAMFREYGSGAYLGEPVSMTEHMLQSAYAAEQEGAPPRLVAAALLHDYGHFIHDLPEDSAEHGVDTRHEEVAHAFLSEHFGPARSSRPIWTSCRRRRSSASSCRAGRTRRRR